MLRLFSRFDLFFLGCPLFLVFFLSLLIFFNCFSSNFFLVFLFSVKIFIYKFFCSLKVKEFRKISFFLFFCLIFFIFIFNFFSVFPFVFPFTSQISIVFFFGVRYWLGLNFFINFFSIKSRLSHFVPRGAPIVLVPFLFVIEVIRRLIRPLTLSVRLVSNILAGHLLLILLSKVVFFTFLASPFYFLLNLVEFFVGLIQSYIFVTLVSLYFCEVE